MTRNRSYSTASLTGMAEKTVAGCVERINPPYEQGADAFRNGRVRATVAKLG